MIEHLSRILARTDETASGCWLWTGSTLGAPPRDYGRTSIDGRLWLVHRAVYTILVGPVPKALDLHHECEVPRCCNPDHLTPISRSEHLKISGTGRWRAAFERAKTHCPAGHAYDEKNTYLTSRGHRQCRICRSEANRRHDARRRAT